MFNRIVNIALSTKNRIRGIHFGMWACLCIPTLIAGYFAFNPITTIAERGAANLLLVVILYYFSTAHLLNKRFRMIGAFVISSSCFIFSLVEAGCFYMTGDTFDFRFFYHFNLSTMLHGGFAVFKWQLFLGAILVITMIIAFYYACRYTVSALSKSIPAKRTIKGTLARIGIGAAFGCSYLLCCDLPVATYLKQALNLTDTSVIQYTRGDLDACGIAADVVSKDQLEATPGKNLVFIYLEGYDSVFVNNPNYPELSPNISRLLATEATSFTNVEQAPYANFTLGGMFASMTGSVLTKFHVFKDASRVTVGTVKDMNRNYVHSFGDQLLAMPNVLHKAGYYQVFAMAADKEFGGTDCFLNNKGFDEILQSEDFTPYIGKQANSGWGVYDQALFDFAYLKFVELSKRGKPFNLTLATADTHAPVSQLPPNCISYGDGKDLLMSAVHNDDQIIERFINRLKQLPAWKDTVVVFVSDHYNPESRIAKANPSVKRRLVFFALNAGDQKVIDTPAATFDVAPTILDLLTVKHNYRFPLGQSLLQANPDARRLTWNKHKRRVWEAHCHKNTSAKIQATFATK